MFVFEDKIDEIDKLLAQSKSQWKLDSINWIDYDDICQVIRIHIKTKWELWDQNRSFGAWCRTVINNQIRNEIRNNYTTFAKPCIKCPHYVSETGCSFTESKKQDNSCPDYEKWFKKKKSVHDVELALPIDSVVINNSTELYDELDFEKSSASLHSKMLDSLSNRKYKEIYRLLHIEGVSETEVAKKMGFKKESGKRKSDRYKQMDNIEKKFIALAKKILDENDIIE